VTLLVRSVVGLAVLLLLDGCASSNQQGVSATASSIDVVADDPVVIRRSDFQVTYRLDGLSVSSEFVGLLSNPQLSFIPSVAADSRVTRGQELGVTVVDPEVVAALQASSTTSRNDAARLSQLRSLEGPVLAPVGGVFSMVGSSPVVHSPGIDVVVGLSPIQGLRYRSLVFSGRATIDTVLGQRQVACEGIWTVETDPAQGSGDEFGGPELRCRLPGYLETAPGLRAQVNLESERFRDVIVIPNIYIRYDPGSDGYVIRVMESGNVVTIPVTVGVTDGVVRVITSDVPVGAVLVPPEER